MITRIKRRIIKMWRHSPFYHVKKIENPIRWGIIGLGYMGETFATAIDGNKSGTVAAVSSRFLAKAQSFAKHHGGCKAFGSYQDMLNDDSLRLDIVYIATPVATHYEYIKLCLEAGKNVLCEKPISLSSSEMKELMKLAKTNNCFLMEGMWTKCLPSFCKADEWVAQGKIGSVQLVRADFYKREHIREGYAIYQQGEGGVIKDFGIYAIAFICHFLNGAPEFIKGFQRRSFPLDIDTDWNIIAENNGIKAFVNLSSDFGSLSKAAVIGTEGFIEWDSQFNRTNTIRRYNKNGELEETYKVKYHFDGFEYEVDEVQNCIKNNRTESILVPLTSSLITTETIERLIASHK